VNDEQITGNQHPKGVSRWDPAQTLKTEDDVRLFIEACFDEDHGDGSLIRKALGAVARAHGMTELARKTGLAREGLYRALSENGNPAFSTVAKVCTALGVKLVPRPSLEKLVRPTTPLSSSLRIM
jgi:probable addiction module antidote protein